MLTLSNPITPSASAAINSNNHRVSLAGQALSTGLKGASSDVVSSFLGNGLSDKALILSKINANMSYSTNALKSALNGLDKMATSLTEMLSVIAQSTGNSSQNRETLNDILQQKMQQIELQTKSTNFDNRQLLMGDLGSDPAVAAKFDTKAVSVKTLANGGTFAAAGTKAKNTLTVGANTALNDVVQFGGVQFKAVSNDPSKEGEFKLGSTVQETARNLATAILSSSDEGLKNYSVTVDDANAAVVVEQLAADVKPIPLQGNANITNVVTQAGTQGGLNLAGIKDIEGFINSPTANFSVIGQELSAGGTNAAKTLASQFNNAEAIAANGADGDAAAAFKVTIDGKEFTGAMFYANGGTMNGRLLTMTHAPTGESFSIQTDGAFAGGVAGDLDTANNAENMATAMTTLFAQSRLNQTQFLAVDTDRGDIFNAEGAKVASMNGLSVSMTSTSFLNKKFTDFKIEDAGGGNVKFTAFVSGSNGNQEFTATRTAGAQIAEMVQGFKLDLTDASTGDVLSINLGEGGLTKVSEVKNHFAIQEAYKNSLMNVGSGLDVQVGLEFDAVLNVGIKDVSAQKLYRDDAGKYHANLSIVDEADAKVAQGVVENALAYIRAEQAHVQTQMETVREASEAMQSIIDITKESAASYLEADLIESSQEFSSAIKKILAAVSTIQAGNQISQAAQQLLQGL